MSHGSREFNILAPRSKLYQGPFGRLFSELPAWSPVGVKDHEIEKHFLDIANNEMVEAPGQSPSNIARDQNLRDELESAFGSNIPAGYTYFGQFVDHDITFDPASSLMRANDPSGLLNHRTPRLDLDSIYGSGPTASPHLYDKDDKNYKGDKDKLLTDTIPGTNLKDLPRNRQYIALIGDMRNDENAMVSQLQLAFILALNELVDRARKRAREQKLENITDTFEEARTTLRWLYQHIVWNDFINRVTINEVRAAALVRETTPAGHTKWELGLDDIYDWRNQPFMPVEFSVAAYRFGHSMVRNAYQTNQPHRGFGNFAPIFDNTGTDGPHDLRGFRPMKPENSIQWDWFLEMTTSSGSFPQRARKIDTKLSNALTLLPDTSVETHMNILAFRNLMRGCRFGLPSGTDVAKKLCVEPIDIEQDHDSLWFYILKEAAKQPGDNGGQMLGQVGSIIVCATFAGLLKGDPNSYFNIEPHWVPDDDPLLTANDNQDPGDWTLASIIRLSKLPASAEEFSSGV